MSSTCPNPFNLPGRWLKGNLHTHTTKSDGHETPGEAIRWYAGAGYDFLALTDHRCIPCAEDITDTPASFTVIPGEELNFRDSETGAEYHVVCLGCHDTIVLPDKLPTAEAVAVATDKAALAFLAHPYWHGLELDDLLRAQGVFGVEVWNTTCEKLCGKGLSVVHWDALLRRGHKVWGLAVDDAHWSRADHGEGWVWVRAEENTVDQILAALKRGDFYSSTGPVIEAVEVTERKVYVRCSPADRIVFAGPGPRGRVICASPGASVTEAEYEYPAGIAYLRIHVVDSCGRMAWTNPLVFK